MPERAQVIEVLEVTRELLVKDKTELNRTTIRGQLTIGDAETHQRSAVDLYGDLAVKGAITGQLNGIVAQINASDGIISAERIDPNLIRDLRARLDKMITLSQAAIAVAILALLIVIGTLMF